MSNNLTILFASCILIFLSTNATSQTRQFWEMNNSNLISDQDSRQIPSENFITLRWELEEIKAFLSNTPDEYSLEAQRMFKRLNIPDLKGNSITFRVLKTELLSPETAQAFPFLQAYILISDDQPSLRGRLLLSHLGVHISYMDNGFVTYIEPFKSQSDKGLHFMYQSNEISQPLDFQCLTEHGDDEIDTEHEHGNSRYGDCQLRTYRFAVAATGEYTVWAGSQANALAAIAATVNNMNVVFERDVEVRLMLVSNLSIIFPDPGTDPYGAALNQALLDTNTSTLNSNIGIGNYDIGHLFNAGWNGGLAYRPATCGVNKGGGATGMNVPTGFVFETLVNHEVGHMLSARHSFSANNGIFCGPQIDNLGSYEPGGGSTLMGYDNNCSPNSYQSNADNYFHTTSMSMMATYVTSGTGNTCGTLSGGNNAPIVTVPQSSYSIPNGTPFLLSASGSDPNGNTLTYTWEQIDLAPVGGLSTPPLSTDISGPNFRSRPPSTSPTRYFPAFDNVVSGVDNVYEVLPTVARTLNFRVTVRDNAALYGCTDEADVAITTTGSGPFRVTAPTGPVSFNFNGSNTFNVTWDVAGSASAPVNCANVDILFSDDDGATFSTILLSSTPNDGSQSILVPNIETTLGRILVRCSNGIFYNVNEGLITINSGCLAVGGTITPATQLTAEEGSPELSNLGMAPVFGQVITPVAGTIANDDIASNLATFNTDGISCISFGNQVRVDTIPFYVSVSGTYTINRTNNGLTTNIYQPSYSTGAVCQNFIASSSIWDGNFVNLSNTVTASLTAGLKYILLVSSFATGSPALPAAYTINVTSAPPGGSLISGPLNPGGGFSYTFIVRDALLGNIVLIGDNPDLSTLPSGNYIITGLSYSNSSTLPSLPLNYSTFISDYVVNGFSGFCGKASLNERTVIIQSPLSVNFLSFEAHKEGARGLLKWEVSDERDLDYYLLEHSPDALNFSKLGIIEANYSGKSGENLYQYYDDKPFSGKNYYRLSGVDLDGTLSSAGIAQLTFVGDLSMRIFPNPVSENQLTFVYDSESESDRLMSIYNMQGLLMSQTKISGLSAKAAPQNINISGLAPGVYIFEIIEGESTLRKRFVKSK